MAGFLAEHFAPQTTREAAKHLFKESVSRVEVETHSYCNRRCGYCPNVVGDRLTPNVRMADGIFSKIAAGLGEIDYSKMLIFSGYNEPLSDRHILVRIAEAREAAPKCIIRTYTNGDYLTPDYLHELGEAGLSSMHISIHMNPEDKYSDTYALNRIAEVAQRIAIKPNFKHLQPGRLIVALFQHKKIKIETRAINYWDLGENRGGLIEGIKDDYERHAPCHFPFFHFYVGFEGHMVPCCHLRSDRQEHAKYRLGNLDDFGSIYEAYAAKAAVGWRRHLATFEKKDSPCQTCSVAFLDGRRETLESYRRVYKNRVEGWLKPRGVESEPKEPAAAQ